MKNSNTLLDNTNDFDYIKLEPNRWIKEITNFESIPGWLQGLILAQTVRIHEDNSISLKLIILESDPNVFLTL